MKSLGCIFLALFCVVAGAEEGFHVFEYKGYDDTPFIAGTPFRVHQQDRPLPPRVLPSAPGIVSAPSDAIVLFSGDSLDEFEDNAWSVKDGHIVAGDGSLVTKRAFGDCQIHLEWRAPAPPSGDTGNMGNSGLYLMGRYEIQIYDSYSVRIYADGSAGAIYGQTPPLVNASRKPGEWQSFDIVFKAPVFKGERLVEPGTVTALHNGVLIHNNAKILGPTAHKTAPPYAVHPAKLPLHLQGHGSPVQFRHFWVREVDL